MLKTNQNPSVSDTVESLAAELLRSCQSIVEAIEQDDLDRFEALVEARLQLLGALSPLVNRMAVTPDGAAQVCALLKDASKAEAQMMELMYQNLESLRSELEQVGEAQTNLGRLAETYGLN